MASQAPLPSPSYPDAPPAEARFAPEPGRDEGPALATRLLARLEDGVEAEAAVLAALQAAEVDRHLRFPDPFRSPRHGVSLDGFSLHSGVRVHADDRQGLVSDLVTAGQLERVLPRWADRGAPLHLIWPSRRFEPAAVTRYRDALAEALLRVLGAMAWPSP